MSSITCVTPSRSRSLTHTNTHTHTQEAEETDDGLLGPGVPARLPLMVSTRVLRAHSVLYLHTRLTYIHPCSLFVLAHWFLSCTCIHTYSDAANSCSTFRYIERERERERRNLDCASVISTLAARPQHPQQHLVSLLRLCCLQT